MEVDLVGLNNLKQLPKELKELSNLEKLNLWESGLKELPNFLPISLKVLSFGGHHCAYGADGNLSVKFLPKNINRYSNLEELHLPHNSIVRLPEELGELKKLKILDLFENSLIELPNSIVNLENLQQLDLGWNTNLILTPLRKEWLQKLKENGCVVKIYY